METARDEALLFSCPRIRRAVTAGLSKPVLFLLGPYGSGKREFLQAAFAMRSLRSDQVLSLDLGALEPTPKALRSAVDGLLARSVAAADTTAEHPCFLVLHSIHQICDEESLKILQGYIGLADSTLHVVLVGQRNPGLRLARFRIPGVVAEVGPAALQLSEQEAQRYLVQSGLKVSSEEAHRLYRFTRGWLAGLRMAVSLGQEKEALGERFSAVAPGRFSAWTAELLSQEILPGLDAPYRPLLLRASYGRKLGRSLVEKLASGINGQGFLDEAAGAGLIFPEQEADLPKHSERLYSFHPMVKAALESLADRTLSLESIDEARRLAIDWYEETGQFEVAIQESLRYGEFSRALRLITEYLYLVLTDSEGQLLLEWMEGIPAPKKDEGYIYALLNAWANFTSANTKQARIWLARADQALELGLCATEDTRYIHETIRIGVLVFEGCYEEAIALGEQVLGELGDIHLFLRGTILHNMGEALVRLGRYEAATDYFLRARTFAELSGRRTIELLCMNELCTLQVMVGHLDAASNVALRALRSCSEEELKGSWAVGLLYTSLARVHMSWGDTSKAFSYLKMAFDLLGPRSNRDGYLEAQVVYAKCKRMEGAVEEAYDIVSEAYAFLGMDKIPRGVNLYVLHGFVAELSYSGRLTQARSVLEEALGQTDPRDSYYGISALLIQARFHLLTNTPQEALVLLDQAATQVESSGLRLWADDIMVFRACAAAELGDREGALAYMAEALRNASEEEHRYPFRRRIPHLDSLVYEIAYPASQNNAMLSKRSAARGFARRLCESMDGEPKDPAAAVLRDDLSAREQQVLDLLLEGRTRRQIADELDLKLNTVRSHIRNIYTKLDIHSRNDLAGLR